MNLKSTLRNYTKRGKKNLEQTVAIYKIKLERLNQGPNDLKIHVLSLVHFNGHSETSTNSTAPIFREGINIFVSF